MKKQLQIWILLGAMIFSFSCKRQLYSDSETVLARVGDNYLYLSDMTGNIPQNINKTDSIQLLNSMVNNWVRQELLLLHADETLSDSLKDFSAQLKEYENNLLIYEFKKRYVEQRIDTNVSSLELEDYYQNHLQDFQLKENIVQFVFIKIPIQSEMVEQARELVQNISDTAIDRSMVQDFCQQNAVDYYLNDEHWISFTELLKKVPLEVFNQEIYLKNNRFIEMKDYPFWYFIHLRDFKIKEDVSPLDFQKKKIKNIILNKRKLELLSSLDEEVYQTGANNQQFEIY